MSDQGNERLNESLRRIATSFEKATAEYCSSNMQFVPDETPKEETLPNPMQAELTAVCRFGFIRRYIDSLSAGTRSSAFETLCGRSGTRMGKV